MHSSRMQTAPAPKTAAAMAVLGGGGVCPECVYLGVCSPGVCLPGGCLPRGVCLGVSAPGSVCPGVCVCHTPPLTCGQTDACENITLFEASFVSVNIYLPRVVNVFYLMSRNRNNPVRSRKAESDPTVRFLRFTGILYRQWILSLLPEIMFGTVTDLMYLRQHTGLLKNRHAVHSVQ